MDYKISTMQIATAAECVRAIQANARAAEINALMNDFLDGLEVKFQNVFTKAWVTINKAGMVTIEEPKGMNIHKRASLAKCRELVTEGCPKYFVQQTLTHLQRYGSVQFEDHNKNVIVLVASDML